MFATGLVVPLFDLTIPLFIGRVVKLVSSLKPAELFAMAGPELAGAAAVLLLGRPND